LRSKPLSLLLPPSPPPLLLQPRPPAIASNVCVPASAVSYCEINHTFACLCNGRRLTTLCHLFVTVYRPCGLLLPSADVKLDRSSSRFIFIFIFIFF
jgi:hypothetical protein